VIVFRYPGTSTFRPPKQGGRPPGPRGNEPASGYNDDPKDRRLEAPPLRLHDLDGRGLRGSGPPARRSGPRSEGQTCRWNPFPGTKRSNYLCRAGRHALGGLRPASRSLLPRIPQPRRRWPPRGRPNQTTQRRQYQPNTCRCCRTATRFPSHASEPETRGPIRRRAASNCQRNPRLLRSFCASRRAGSHDPYAD
jgi:hypothetical protein